MLHITWILSKYMSMILIVILIVTIMALLLLIKTYLQDLNLNLKLNTRSPTYPIDRLIINKTASVTETRLPDNSVPEFEDTEGRTNSRLDNFLDPLIQDCKPPFNTFMVT